MPHFSGGFPPPLSFWACSSSGLPCRDRCLRGWGRPGLPGRPLQGTSAFWQALGLASPPQHAGEACVPPAGPGKGGGGVSGTQLCGAEPGTLGAGRTDIPRPWTLEDPAWAGLSVGAHGPAHARGPGPWLLLGFVWAQTAGLCSAEVGAGREAGLPFSAFGTTPNGREEVRLRGLALEGKPPDTAAAQPPGPHLATSLQRRGGGL